jgi:ribosomal protein S18 acetylase RimI-like enzyme
MLRIRKATLQDLEVLHELQLELAKYEYKLDKNLKNPLRVKEQYYKYYKRKFKNEDCRFFVAEENRKVIGYIVGWIERLPGIYRHKKRGYVADVFVLEEHRGKGVGKKLLEALLKWFKSQKVRWIRLSVYSNNTNAVKVWKKLGFKDYVIEMEMSLKDRN